MIGSHAPSVVRCAVEGPTDEAVVLRLLEEVGATPGPVYGKNGKDALRGRIAGYNNAAHHAPWFVLVDLNHEADCPPPLRRAWLPHQASRMCFRIAVREVESWLLADRERIAGYLAVSVSKVPRDPESIEHPKRSMVNLARRSRLREIREDMVPRPGTGRQVGTAYMSRLIEFVSDHAGGWRPDHAAKRSRSLDRCLRALSSLAGP